ncbi:hypothetical protein PR048_014953 [Dryococelus australis]|uniref:Uncharacterized protein n=1 Tax=Dryococelus australis TaxID=614101 RepID=A0ABQ9HFR9_9NEOP|nr:hypothetical protein PR048_014953 [Dryococelus australis]
MPLHAPAATIEFPQSLHQLLAIITDNLSAFKTLDIPVVQWDQILLPIVSKCLGPGLQTQWEITFSDDFHTLSECLAFLERNCKVCEALGGSKSKCQWIYFIHIHVSVINQED